MSSISEVILSHLPGQKIDLVLCIPLPSIMRNKTSDTFSSHPLQHYSAWLWWKSLILAEYPGVCQQVPISQGIHGNG